MSALTEETANAVFDVLVEHCGAPEAMREDFLASQTHTYVDEYRFGGTLGSGGKFYRNAGEWYVACYPEDRTPERDATAATVRPLLDDIRRGAAEDLPPT